MILKKLLKNTYGWTFNDSGLAPSNENLTGKTDIVGLPVLQYETETSSILTNDYDVSYFILDTVDEIVNLPSKSLLYIIDSGTQYNSIDSLVKLIKQTMRIVLSGKKLVKNDTN